MLFNVEVSREKKNKTPGPHLYNISAISYLCNIISRHCNRKYSKDQKPQESMEAFVAVTSSEGPLIECDTNFWVAGRGGLRQKNQPQQFWPRLAHYIIGRRHLQIHHSCSPLDRAFTKESHIPRSQLTNKAWSCEHKD